MSNDGRGWRRKTRTREHVIADLGVNFVGRQILLAGYTAERVAHDYGIDLIVYTYGEDGEPENGHLAFQVKATDSFTVHAGGRTAPVRVATVDLRYWLFEWVPVILVIYDAANDRGFWVDVQRYAEEHEINEDDGETVVLRVPTAQPFDVRAVRLLREWKQQQRDRHRTDPGA